MLIKEYRIPLPLSIDEYKRGQLYMIAKYTRENCSGADFVEIKENHPYDDENGQGQYTYKIIHLDSHIPSWLKIIVPASALEVHEKAWNAYPYSKTVYSCPFFGERFSLTIETKYLPDEGQTENALDLNAATLKERQIDVIDIVVDPIDPAKYKESEDLTKFRSEKTGRGPYAKGWLETCEQKMCCYKLCSVDFRYWGFQKRVENYVQQVGLRGIFLQGHKQVVSWIDEWIDMSIEDIRKYEDATKQIMDEITAKQMEAQKQVTK